jgi:predicted MFS family arabinose efflux permease
VRPGGPTAGAEIDRSVLLLSLACCVSMMSQRICDAMLPELSRQFDASLAAAAQVVSLFAVTYGLAQFFYGALGDRHGKWRVVTYTTLACGLGNAVAVLAGSLEALVLARVLAAAFAAAIIPMSLAWTGDAVPYQRRQETLARVGLGTTSGIFTGQLLGGLISDTVGWRWAFVLMTVLFLTVGWLLQRNWQAQQRSGAPTAVADANAPGMVDQTLALMRSSWVRKMIALAVLQGAGGFGMLAIVASHLHLQHGLSLSGAGSVVSLMGLGGVLYMALARRVIGLLGERGMVIVGGLGVALALLAVAWSPSWVAIALSMLLGGFAFFMLHNTLQTLATQMAPQNRGMAVSLFATALFMGQALGVLLASLLIAPLGSSLVISGGALVMAGVGLTLHALLRRRHRLAIKA